MDNYKFTLRNDLRELNGSSIGRFEAFFPDSDADGAKVNRDDIPEYVDIENAVFKKKFNGGNQSIFILPDVLLPSPKNAPRAVQFQKATRTKFFWYKLRQDSSQKIGFWGLMIAAAGVLIDGSFAIGKVHVFIPVGTSLTVALMVLAMALKIVGLWLVFKKGFWS